jgi:hypothetical protein
MTSNVMKISKKRENALLEKSSKSFFQLFFLLKLSLSDPLLGFYSKKTDKYSFYIFFKYQKTFFFIEIIYVY